MPRRIYSFSDPLHEIQPIDLLESNWAGAANQHLAREVGFLEQYRDFHRFLLNNLQSVPEDNPDVDPSKVWLSVRAGAIKAYVLLTVSIVEGAMFSLAEERRIGGRRIANMSFGGLLRVFRNETDFTDLIPKLEEIKNIRNFYHPANAIVNSGSYWREILDNETEIIGNCDLCVDEIKGLCHVFREI